METSTSWLLERIFATALFSVDPYQRTSDNLDPVHREYQQGKYEKLLILGFGKAACPMTRAAADVLNGSIDSGVIITKRGYTGPENFHKKITIFEAGHPIPDEDGCNATRQIIRLAGNNEKNFVLCLISGGGSALLVAPAEGLTLAEKQAVTDLLLRAGAPIHELNAVRKHLSRVKGGRLAETFYPARIHSLILSDVLGDRLDVIASGPMTPDGSTYAEAVSVLEKYRLTDRVPHIVLEHLLKGERGDIPETPKADSHLFERVTQHIIASNRIAVQAAGDAAERMGCQVEIFTWELAGEAREAGRRLAEKALQTKRNKEGNTGKIICLVSGGETTVTVRGEGKGGRSMELALSFALAIEGNEGIALLSAGTDGTDGPTDAAGAMVDGRTVSHALTMGFDAGNFLNRNDSYHFFKNAGGLFTTGPTGTNVMDLQIIIID
ncbi:MAG: glycerate kinase [Syntrophales bacterium]|jgi:hydroxypyruvate reductase/glycerate 2-kinase